MDGVEHACTVCEPWWGDTGGGGGGGAGARVAACGSVSSSGSGEALLDGGVGDGSAAAPAQEGARGACEWERGQRSTSQRAASQYTHHIPQPHCRGPDWVAL
jgi:hypothetical protein